MPVPVDIYQPVLKAHVLNWEAPCDPRPLWLDGHYDLKGAVQSWYHFKTPTAVATILPSVPVLTAPLAIAEVRRRALRILAHAEVERQQINEDEASKGLLFE